MKKLMLGVMLLGCVGCFNKNIKVADQGLNQTVKVSVLVSSGETNYRKFGAGVFISKRGHILTAAHLFAQDTLETQVDVYNFAYASYDAKILLVDHDKDLALIKINYPSYKYASLAPVNSIKVGESVIAVGHPLGLEYTVTHGIVSKVTHDEMLIQTDAGINRGNSGGPLFDMEGRLVGINVHIYTPSPFGTSAGLGRASSTKAIHEFLSVFKGLN